MGKQTSTDQLGDTSEFNYPPRRIVSLVPSQTELLFDLGLEEQIVGITRYCTHPADKVKMAAKIGGTKHFDIAKIKTLQPDLVIGNKEENYLEGINELRQHFPVWMSDIFTLNDAYKMMEEVANITGKTETGIKLVHELQQGLAGFVPFTGAKVAYFIWRNPYMVAAGNTFINHMLSKFGVSNVFDNLQRYPEINPEELAKLQPEYIFLSSEPYSFSERHIEEFKSFSPASKIILVDGEIFSWYGSRLKYAPDYFNQLKQQLD